MTKDNTHPSGPAGTGPGGPAGTRPKRDAYQPKHIVPPARTK